MPRGRPRKIIDPTDTTVSPVVDTDVDKIQVDPSVDDAPRRERRFRPDMTGNALRLAVNAPRLRNYALRWTNDINNRLYNAIQKDWDHVKWSEIDAVGTKTARRDENVKEQVGVKDGQPLYAYLMKKYKKWKEEDDQAKYRAVDERERTILKANIPGVDSDRQYVPKGDKNEITFGKE